MEIPMDIRDSSIPEPSPEIHEEGNSEAGNSEAGNSEGTASDVDPLEDFESIGGNPRTAGNWRVNPGGTRASHHTRAPEMPKVDVAERYRLLFEAAVKGDWKGAEEILDRDSNAIGAPLLNTASGPATVIDIAATAGQDQFIENLLEHVRLTDGPNGFRWALCHATRTGGIRRMKELLIGGTNEDVHFAWSIAIESAPTNKEVIRYLATQSRSFPEFDVVLYLIKDCHWDILLYLIRECRGPVSPEVGESILNLALYTNSLYRSGAQLNFWEKCIYQCIAPSVDTSSDNASVVVEPAIRQFKILAWNLATKAGKIAYRMLRVVPFINRIGELKLRHESLVELAKAILKMKRPVEEPSQILRLTEDIVARAAISGIFEIVKLFLEQWPELMWDEDFTKVLIERAVRARHVELFRLLIAYKPIRRLMYGFRKNCDLMAAVVEWSPGCVAADVSGSAFLMQRELQWFEVLEDGSSHLLKSIRIKMEDESNLSSILDFNPMEWGAKTYWGEFVKNREDLLQEARRWMKDTSSSCSLVATLITTVAFAAAFTVPGSNSNRGIPIFLKKTSFTVFTVADALALFSSVTATLMFLAILTSRYAAKDFLRSLPRKMILGLTFLFLSLAFMLVAFGSALMIVLSKRWKWIYIPITLLAAVPIILFAILQLPLYVEMVESTYRPRLYRPMKI